MNCSTPGLPVHHQLPEFTETHGHRVSDAIQPSHPLLSPSPPAPNPSKHQGLFHESTLRMRWPKYWSFSFSIIPPKEIPGLISFRMDWLDLLAVQGTLKSLLQHHSSKASILLKSLLLVTVTPACRSLYMWPVSSSYLLALSTSLSYLNLNGPLAHRGSNTELLASHSRLFMI